LADEKSDKVVTGSKTVKKTVKNVQHFDNFDELFKDYKPEQDYPGADKDGLIDWWFSRPTFKERIEKYGIWVFELEAKSSKLEANDIMSALPHQTIIGRKKKTSSILGFPPHFGRFRPSAGLRKPKT